ncbi:uncharacterized protein SPAPADRAFT_134615 [Spathaspora passalidarum NRRL Y-27907]|uniref:DNA helicase n=1 Tax=Spathaspora passalidarum (strain NRRL Y-27907 / 11-Y1) TaxID=619300 RepID=G3AI11_SPAPN|nr:uncharacterized protein SPAPADRAFT_134615 [Spathaspora passalidarum NRRL Y-27907]EGW34325.1 hypothetical protein SPAPADRAFT_134615 [Spathaspora passalidarum NRRL Y-27907]
MSKEYTIFALDASKSMGRHSSHPEKSDLTLASDFVFDYLNRQLVKNRKSDRFALVLFSGHNVQILYENKPLSLAISREYNSKVLQFYYDDAKVENQDAKYQFSDALKLALEQFQISAHLKFSRNLFVLTNGELPFNSFVTSDWSDYHDWVENYNITVTLGIINYTSGIKKSENKQGNERMCKEISEFGDRYLLYDMDTLLKARPPLKLIGPRVLCSAKLSFAGDAAQYWKLDLDDSGAVSMEIQVYPAIKLDKFAHGHEYYMDRENETLTQVKRSTTYYIKKTSDTNEFQNDESDEVDDLIKEEETIPVSSFDCTPGFKFSPRDILAVNSDLQEVATLISKPSIDILGFIKKEKFPVAYHTDESLFVLPSSHMGGKNKSSFDCLVQALLELESIAIVRYTQYKDSEVKLCAAYPSKVKLDGSSARVLLLIRIAMKEDEKIGRFPSLTKPNENMQSDNNETSKKIDRVAADNLMEQLIKSKKLKDEKILKDTLDNRKVGLLRSESIGTPVTDGTGLSELLMSSNPGGRKFNHYLSKIISKSLSTKSLFNFLNEEKFVENYLSKDESTVLFTTQNVLDSSLIYTGEETKENSITEKLRKELDVEYITQRKESNRKAGRKYDSIYGQDPKNDANFDEYFDIDDLLAS